MSVVLINGSPRKEGCTYTALKEVAFELEKAGLETKIIQASMNAEDIKSAADLIRSSDALVVGSPVYYASASGLCTYFLDELFNRIGHDLRLKPAAAIVSCRRGGASATFDQINKYFMISQMVVVSSNYWNQVHGNTPEEVMQDEEGMQTMRILGRNLAYVIKSFKAYTGALPEEEKRIKTNFIR